MVATPPEVPAVILPPDTPAIDVFVLVCVQAGSPARFVVVKSRR